MTVAALPPPSTEPRLPDLLFLRPYQRCVMRHIRQSVREAAGRTITVEIARQGGKNEVSAQLELGLLCENAQRGVEIVKCAPTFRPQLRVSMRRLLMRLRQGHVADMLRASEQMLACGSASIHFLSADPAANVAGHTASLLLEADEAQAIDVDVFEREFRPMAATANATTVLYGTAWDDRTLLERAKQANLEAQRRDGIRRHFEYDWQVVARYNPSYAAYVEHERRRLGETHPLFLTQYCLKTIAGGGRLFSAGQRAQLAGTHARQSQPVAGESYCAGLDLAGGDDDASDESPHAFSRASARHDATVLTVGRLVFPASDAIVQQPRIEIVEHYAWSGEPHETLLPRLIDLLRGVWRVTSVAVDATGLGETAARFLAQALGRHRVEPVKFTRQSKSGLGFELMASVNGGRLKMYAGDGSPEYAEFWRQAELARAAYRADQTINFFVDEGDGHDDYLVSAALLVRASRDRGRRIATGRIRDQGLGTGD